MNIMRFLKKQEQAIIIIAILLINFLVKGIFLSNNSLAGDEPFSVYHAQLNIASIVKLLSEGNNPPLYEVALHFWIKIFGISEFSVRFPSLLFSTITLLFIYKIGIKYLNKRVALYSSIIFIFSNYHISFAHEARVYAFLGMLTAVSMYFFMGILYDANANSKAEDNPKLKNSITVKFIILALIDTLIIYAHYFGFFVLIVQFLFLVFNITFLLRHWKNALLSASIVGLLYSPNILVILNRFMASSGGTWVRPPNGIESIYNMLWVFSNAPFVAVSVIAILVASLVKYLVNYKKESKNVYYSLVVFWFVFIFFFMFTVSFWIPMFMDRYLMPAAIAFILVLGISLDYLIKIPKYNYIIPLIICMLFTVTTKPNLTNKRNAEAAVEKIKELKTGNTIVYFCPDWFEMNFVYYYNIEHFKDYDDVDIKRKMYEYLHSENIFPISNQHQIDTNLIKQADKLIYLDAAADFHYSGNNIKNVLDAKCQLRGKYNIHEIFNIYEYELMK